MTMPGAESQCTVMQESMIYNTLRCVFAGLSKGPAEAEALIGTSSSPTTCTKQICIAFLESLLGGKLVMFRRNAR